MIDRRAFAAASIASNASLVTSAVVGLVLAALIVRYLGAAQFGVWAILNTITHYASLASVGVPAAITWRVASERGGGRPHSSRETIVTGGVLMSVLGAIVGMLVVFASDLLAVFFRIPDDMALAFNSAVVALGVAIALGSLANAITAGLIGLERVTGSSLLSIVSSATRLSATYFLLEHGFGLPGALWAYALSHLVVVLGGIPMILAAREGEEPFLPGFTMLHIRPLLSFSAGVALLTVASMLTTTSSVVISGHLLPAGEVAMVAVVMMLVGQMAGFVVATLRPLEPRLAALAGANVNAAQLMYKSLFLAAVLTFAILAVLVVLGRDILMLWLGPQYRAAAAPLWAAACALSICVAQIPTVHLIMAKAKHRGYGWLVSLEAAFNILLTIALTTRFGILGAVLGTAIPMGLIRGVFIGVWGCGVLGLDARKYAVSLLAPILAAAATIAVGVLAPRFQDEAPLLNLLLGLPLLFVTFVGALAIAASLVDRRFDSDFTAFALSFVPARLMSIGSRLLQRRTPD